MLEGEGGEKGRVETPGLEATCEPPPGSISDLGPPTRPLCQNLPPPSILSSLPVRLGDGVGVSEWGALWQPGGGGRALLSICLPGTPHPHHWLCPFTTGPCSSHRD